MKIQASTINISVTVETHKLLVAYIEKIEGKIGKFADRAILEKIARDNKTA